MLLRPVEQKIGEPELGGEDGGRGPTAFELPAEPEVGLEVGAGRGKQEVCGGKFNIKDLFVSVKICTLTFLRPCIR